MYPKWIKYNNFKPFTNEEVDFSNVLDTNILVLGENQDSQGENSNGSGKTSLFEGIFYPIYGRTPKKIYADDIIKTGTEQSIVEGEYINGNDVLKVLRKRGVINSLEYWVNGSDDHPKSTPTVTQNALLEYLGVAPNNKDYYNDFLNTTYFSVDALKLFAGRDTSSADRMKIVTRMLNLERLEKALELTKERRKKIVEKLVVNESTHEQFKNQLDGILEVEELENKLEELETRQVWTEKEIEKCKKDIDDCKEYERVTQVLLKQEEYLEGFQQNKKEYVDSVAKLHEEKGKKIAGLQSAMEEKKKLEAELIKLPKIDFLNDAIQEQKDLRSESLEQIKKLEERGFQLKHSRKTAKETIEKGLNCPECKASLMLDDKELKSFDSTAIKAKFKSEGKSLEAITTQLFGLEDSVEINNKEIEKLQEVKVGIIRLTDTINTINVETEGELARLEAELTQLKKDAELKVVEMDKKEAEITKEKEKLEKKIKLLESDSTDLEFLKASQKKAEAILLTISAERGEFTSALKIRKELTNKLNLITKKVEVKKEAIAKYLLIEDCFSSIRRWKIESFCPEFENLSNKYLNTLKCNYQVSLSTLKEKKSARKDETRYKVAFEIGIIDSSGHIRGIETFSKGEQTRIAICLGLALREITLQRGGVYYDFLLLDDIAGEIDETGANELVSILNTISGTKLVVSQNENLKRNFTNILKVTKINNESKISWSNNEI